jgi:hypothetical protein
MNSQIAPLRWRRHLEKTNVSLAKIAELERALAGHVTESGGQI